jgi:hypothetical protein
MREADAGRPDCVRVDSSTGADTTWFGARSRSGLILSPAQSCASHDAGMALAERSCAAVGVSLASLSGAAWRGSRAPSESRNRDVRPADIRPFGRRDRPGPRRDRRSVGSSSHGPQAARLGVHAHPCEPVRPAQRDVHQDGLDAVDPQIVAHVSRMPLRGRADPGLGAGPALGKKVRHARARSRNRRGGGRRDRDSGRESNRPSRPRRHRRRGTRRRRSRAVW